MTRRYGMWSGNPKGVPENPTKCIKECFCNKRYRSHQCHRDRGHGEDQLYCRQHAAQQATWKERVRKGLNAR